MKRVVLWVMGIVSFITFHAVDASPYATEVIRYTAGTNAAAGFHDPTTTLGEPLRHTGTGVSDGDVTPFNSQFRNNQIVSIGVGGELVVKFDHPVVDQPAGTNWGLDFIVFGNTFYISSGGVATGVNAEPGHIAVSDDGINFFDVAGAFADTAFPTLGFSDSTSPSGRTGTIPTDFTKPVDPSFSGLGETFSQIVAGYNGSGGGTGFDFSSTGLSEIQYVRVYQPATDSSGVSTEVDGFAIVSVPEPASAALIGLSVLGMAAGGGRRRHCARKFLGRREVMGKLCGIAAVGVIAGGLASAQAAVPFVMNGHTYSVEHISGTGPDKTVLELDFGTNATPQVYLFGYQWDPATVVPHPTPGDPVPAPAPNGRDIMTSLQSDNVDFSFVDFPPTAPFYSAFLSTLWYQANQPGDDYPNAFWYWFLNPDGQQWIWASTGYDHTAIVDGEFYGWALQHDDPNIPDYPDPPRTPSHFPAPIAVPEPGTLALLGLAAAGLLARKR